MERQVAGGFSQPPTPKYDKYGDMIKPTTYRYKSK
jgi:hypothetical protein